MGCLEMRNINLEQGIMFTYNFMRYVQFESFKKILQNFLVDKHSYFPNILNLSIVEQKVSNAYIKRS